jgi:hypothetical protein
MYCVSMCILSINRLNRCKAYVCLVFPVMESPLVHRAIANTVLAFSSAMYFTEGITGTCKSDYKTVLPYSLHNTKLINIYPHRSVVLPLVLHEIILVHRTQ